jgi:hypothetical protein
MKLKHRNTLIILINQLNLKHNKIMIIKEKDDQ